MQCLAWRQETRINLETLQCFCASLGQGGAMPHPIKDVVFRGAERASGQVRFPDVMQSILSEKGST